MLAHPDYLVAAIWPENALPFHRASQGLAGPHSDGVKGSFDAVKCLMQSNILHSPKMVLVSVSNVIPFTAVDNGEQ